MFICVSLSLSLSLSIFVSSANLQILLLLKPESEALYKRIRKGEVSLEHEFVQLVRNVKKKEIRRSKRNYEVLIAKG